MSIQGIAATSREEFTTIQEMLYEVRVGDVMTPDVLTLGPADAMEAAKESMRLHRISGLPVVSGESLVGIVSIEDVIRWLERGAEPSAVRDWMTPEVQTVERDDPAIRAVSQFGKTRVGRLPVLGPAGELVGIVTPGDVMGRLLRIMDARIRAGESSSRARPGSLHDLIQPGAALRISYQVVQADLERAGAAATRIKRLLGQLAIDPALVRRIAIAAYEAEMNLAIHTTRGGSISAEVQDGELVIEAVDDGPGITDVDRAMQEGFSTAPDWVRALGFGAGMGLNNIQRCADEFSIESRVGEGTVVRARFSIRPRERKS